MTAQKLEEIKLKSLENYKKLMEELEEKYKKGMETSPKAQELVKSVDKANTAAYDVFLKTYETNNAKADEAFEDCRRKQEEMSTKFKDGEINEDEYKAAHQKAYDDACKIKEQYDKANDEAYETYRQSYDSNIQKLKTVQKEQVETANLSAPSGSNPKAKVDEALDKMAETQKRSVKVQSANVEDFINAFNKKFGEDEWYKKNPPKKNEDGSLSLSFKSDKDMVDFFKDKAKDGKSFIMVDGQTNKVIGFSNGDGKLYKPGPEGSKKEFSGGFPTADELKTLPDKDSFKMPDKGSDPQPEPQKGMENK